MVSGLGINRFSTLRSCSQHPATSIPGSGGLVGKSVLLCLSDGSLLQKSFCNIIEWDKEGLASPQIT